MTYWPSVNCFAPLFLQGIGPVALGFRREQTRFERLLQIFFVSILESLHNVLRD